MPIQVFRDALAWVRETYWQHGFFAERDVVWTVQKQLVRVIKHEQSGFRVFHDFPIMPGSRRALCTDLAIVRDGPIELAAEFKYEPDHRRGGERGEIWPSKLSPSVVFWGKDGVLRDVERCQQYVAGGRCKSAMSIFIDEGQAFRHRAPHPGTKWVDWDYGDKRLVSVLIGEFSG